MKLIVGLGNPDKQYENTYHNLGFICVEKCAKIFDAEFSKQKCRALIAETKVGGEKVIFAKPLTYMNLSGESVRELVNFYKIDVSSVLVLYDDYDLNKGVVRIREEGSAGTHNGMRNIIANLNQTNFPRIRIGFKPETQNVPLIDYVLSGIKEEDRALFDKATTVASNAAADFAYGKAVKDIIAKYSGKTNI